MRRSRTLRHAAADATILLQYFQNAAPEGDWRDLSGGSESHGPTRREVLAKVHWLASQTSDGEAGLFYFSGHGVGGPKGLMLVPSDYQSDLPHDSGVPLQRVIEILKSAGSGKLFLLILDCCRSGTELPLEDDVAPNVCILFASEVGESAQQGSRSGGLLTHSLLRCLASMAVNAGRRSCSVRDLARQLTRAGPSWWLLHHQLQGCWADEISLPTTPHGPRPAARVEPASCLLEYRAGTEQEWYELKDAIASELLQWHHLSPKSRSGMALLKELIIADEDESTLSVRLPDGGRHWRPADLLESLLLVHAILPKIVFVWQDVVSIEFFRPLVDHLRDGRYEEQERFEGPSEHNISWTNRDNGIDYVGNATITESNGRSPSQAGAGPRTLVYLYCVNPLGRRASIRCLLPSLLYVHDLLRYLPKS